VDADEISAIDFSISPQDHDELFRRGTAAAENFLRQVVPSRSGVGDRGGGPGLTD
jgi:hypothetical protein